MEDILEFDKYFWIARIFPALISLIPFFIFQALYLDNLIFTYLKIVEGYSLFFHSIIVLVLIYAASIIVRTFGKDLIEYHYFIKNHKLPTTQILLRKKKEISAQKLRNIKEKIKSDFNIDLNQKCSKREKLLRVKDAADQIRAKVGYDKKILNQYNQEYGFFRNLTGGMIIFFITDVFLSIFSWYNKDKLVVIIGLLFLLCGVIYIFISWKLLDKFGTKYAKQLFNEYLTIN